MKGLEDDNYRNYFTVFIVWGVMAGMSASFLFLIIKNIVQILK